MFCREIADTVFCHAFHPDTTRSTVATQERDGTKGTGPRKKQKESGTCFLKANQEQLEKQFAFKKQKESITCF